MPVRGWVRAIGIGGPDDQIDKAFSSGSFTSIS